MLFGASQGLKPLGLLAAGVLLCLPCVFCGRPSCFRCPSVRATVVVETSSFAYTDRPFRNVTLSKFQLLPASECMGVRFVRQSIDHSDAFWGEHAASMLHWDAPFTRVQGGTFAVGDVNWFAGGKLNVSVNCIDRHLATRGSQVRALVRIALQKPGRAVGSMMSVKCRMAAVVAERLCWRLTCCVCSSLHAVYRRSVFLFFAVK